MKFESKCSGKTLAIRELDHHYIWMHGKLSIAIEPGIMKTLINGKTKKTTKQSQLLNKKPDLMERPTVPIGINF